MIDDVFYPTAYGRIHCREAGDGRTLLLMHSNGRSAYEFDDVAQILADRFRVVAWDMPGHGDSDRVTTALDVADLARLAVDIATRHRASSDGRWPPIVGGSSIGATVALAAGVAHADRLAGIVAIELPLNRGEAWWAANWPHVETMFGIPAEPEELVAKRYRSVSPALGRRLRIDRHKAGGANMMRVLWAGRAVADATRHRIGALAGPALFINGDHGLATDAAEVLPTLNPSARLAVIADSGHFPQTDDPAAVAAAMTSFATTP